MFKNIFFLLIYFCTLLLPQTTFACDPLGCLLIGKGQPLLVVAEAVSVGSDKLDIKIVLTFPQAKWAERIKSGEIVSLAEPKNIPEYFNINKHITIQVGKKYFLHLEKKR